MSDEPSTSAPHSPAPDPLKDVLPSASPAEQRKPAPATVSPTKLWGRKPGAFGRNPVPAE